MSFGPATRYQVTRLFPRRSALSESTRLPSLSFNTSRTFSSSSPVWNEVSNEKGAPREQTPSRTIYIGNVPYAASTEQLEEMFSSFGKIEAVRMKYDDEGKSMGYAHIDFVTEADAVAAVESAQEEPFWLNNRTLMVNFARPGIKRTRTKPPQIPSNRLFFNEFDGTTNDLQQSLEKYAKSIVRIDFHKDRRTGGLLNRGHIRFTSEEIATSALNEMNGSVTDSGSELHLEYAYRRSEN
ncbi:hypothetical protein M378DRAFT_76592 [Amanita muscaria Koide BX008]|uniref:RRM domain-containing protein n=1 Tax=Amanita muscaria (strain Koide BX008) TaxID=946122 RepID=A0A0C2SQQ0_AMAMK|nr:hypothetical protein M378DRAFT_76592 [Amanita muscaria Koide BX008]